MDCREAQTLLTAFHDRELPDADRTRVEGHLSSCLDCGRLLADLARADEIAGVPDPGPGYWTRFNARVADRIERDVETPREAVLRPKQGWMRQQLRYFIPAVAAAALVVVVLRYGERSSVAPKPALPPAESVEERSGPGAAGRRLAKREIDPPAPQRPGKDAASGLRPADSNRTAASPAAPDTVASDRLPTVGREARDRLFDRSLSDEKERGLRDRVAAPAEVDIPSSPPVPTDRGATAASPPATVADGRPAEAQGEPGKMAEAAPAAAEPQHAARASAKATTPPRSSDSARAASPCKNAQALASEGLFREAEAAQRECLARDPSPPTQEKGLIFLAELLDRQSRFAEADAVLGQVHRQFPKSLPLDQYRRQRPMVQKQEVPVPATR